MTKQELLTEAYIKLSEEFRDYDDEINEIEEELYDLIDSVDRFNSVTNLLEYEFDDNIYYDEDIKRGKELQNKLKQLYADR